LQYVLAAQNSIGGEQLVANTLELVKEGMNGDFVGNSEKEAEAIEARAKEEKRKIMLQRLHGAQKAKREGSNRR
jgi:hypothetical protein